MSETPISHGNLSTSGEFAPSYSQVYTGISGQSAQQASVPSGQFSLQPSYSGSFQVYGVQPGMQPQTQPGVQPQAAGMSGQIGMQVSGPIQQVSGPIQASGPIFQPSGSIAPVSQESIQPLGQTAPMPGIQAQLQPSASTSMPQVPVDAAVTRQIAQIANPAVASPYQSQPTQPIQVHQIQATQPIGQAGPFQQAQQVVSEYDEGDMEDYSESSNGKATGSVVLGLLSILLAVVPVLGLVLALVGIHLSNAFTREGGELGRATVGKVFSIFGLIFSIIVTSAFLMFVGYYGGHKGIEVFGVNPIVFYNDSVISDLIGRIGM